MIGRPPVAPEIRFWKHVEKTEGCWNWTGYLWRNGYGRFMKSTKEPNQAAHRYAWELAHGAIPPGISVLHKCDNPRCVNVSHLFLGTQADNIHDKLQKGRQPRGEAHYQHKLRDADIVAIRQAYATGRYTQTEIGRIYGVSGPTVHYIVQHKIWTHLP